MTPHEDITHHDVATLPDPKTCLAHRRQAGDGGGIRSRTTSRGRAARGLQKQLNEKINNYNHNYSHVITPTTHIN